MKDGRSALKRNSDVVALALVVAFGFAVACVTGAVMLGRDPGQIIYFMSPLFGIAFPSIFVVRRVGQVETKVDEIREQTNGHMTRILDAALPSSDPPTVTRRPAGLPREYARVDDPPPDAAAAARGWIPYA
jgi:hypothetical protein